MRTIGLVTLLMMYSLAVDAQSTWLHSHKDDPLKNESYEQFVLTGQFINAPEVGKLEQPRIAIVCRKNKFDDGFIDIGSVVQTGNYKVLGTIPRSALSASSVELRWDNKKSPDTAPLSVSNDGRAVAIPNPNFLKKVLTGSMLGKFKSDALIKSLYVGVVEAAGNKIVMHFDMPADVTELVERCGLR